MASPMRALWPLCHIAHTRPLFRADDWKHYQEVNRKLPTRCWRKWRTLKRPVVLAAGLPLRAAARMIKEQRPEARVAIFWHIPWPNPEAFGICPWQRELVDGLLGADLIGFHIQSALHEFSADCGSHDRIAHRLGSLRRCSGSITAPRFDRFPISVECTELPVEVPRESSYEERGRLFKSLGVEAALMGRRR